MQVQIRWLQAGCPGWPKQARPRLGFCLPPWLEVLSFHKDRNNVVWVPVLKVCTSLQKNAEGVRQAEAFLPPLCLHPTGAQVLLRNVAS